MNGNLDVQEGARVPQAIKILFYLDLRPIIFCDCPLIIIELMWPH